MSHVFQKSDALEHLEKTLCRNMLTGIQKYIYASVVKLHFYSDSGRSRCHQSNLKNKNVIELFRKWNHMPDFAGLYCMFS